MREESHLEEMRSAIRGDFDRLAERRGEQELMRVVEAPPDDEDVDAAATAEPDPEPESEPRRSWLARFLSP